MMQIKKNVSVFVLAAIACVGISSMTGCASLAGATANSDAKQLPPTTAYLSKHTPSQIYTAAAQAMAAFGTLVTQDRESGMLQGQKGNWIISVAITPAGKGGHVDVSARYVPSKRMDFNSREDLTAQYVQLLESKLSEKLSPAS